MLRVLVVTALVLMSTAVSADDFTGGECMLSADRSSVVVVASNPKDVLYRCAALCRVKETGKRPIQRIDCTFDLPANSAEKAVCTHKGGGAGFYSEILPTKLGCYPPN